MTVGIATALYRGTAEGATKTAAQGAVHVDAAVTEGAGGEASRAIITATGATRYLAVVLLVCHHHRGGA